MIETERYIALTSELHLEKQARVALEERVQSLEESNQINSKNIRHLFGDIGKLRNWIQSFSEAKNLYGD